MTDGWLLLAGAVALATVPAWLAMHLDAREKKKREADEVLAAIADKTPCDCDLGGRPEDSRHQPWCVRHPSRAAPKFVWQER